MITLARPAHPRRCRHLDLGRFNSSPLPMHVLQHVTSAETLIAPASNENADDDADNERQNHRV
jgi:hypothetical protein